MCQRRNQRLSDKSWIDNSIKNLAAKKQSFFIKDTCNRKQMIIKRDLIKLGVCYKRVLEKRRNFYQTFLVRNAKRTNKTFFNTIKSLGVDSQKKQQATLTQEETKFQQIFHHHRKNVS